MNTDAGRPIVVAIGRVIASLFVASLFFLFSAYAFLKVNKSGSVENWQIAVISIVSLSATYLFLVAMKWYGPVGRIVLSVCAAVFAFSVTTVALIAMITIVTAGG